MSPEKKSPITKALVYIAKYLVPLFIAATPVVLVMLNNQNKIDNGKKESRYYAGYLRTKVDTLNKQVAALQDSVLLLNLANEQLNAGLAKTEVWRWEAERRISMIEGKLSENRIDTINLGMWREK